MTIDTNIVIAYLAGEQSVTETIISWRAQNTPLFLSSVAESEVLSFSKWTDKELLLTEQFLQENFTTIPFDRTLARFAAEIRRTTKMKITDPCQYTARRKKLGKYKQDCRESPNVMHCENTVVCGLPEYWHKFPSFDSKNFF